MDLSSLYPWIVLVHVLSVLGFLVFHGVSIVVLLRLRTERDVMRVRALMDLSQGSVAGTYVFLLFILLSGILAGIVGAWWTSGTLWIWASLVLLILIAGAMSFVGTGHFAEIRRTAGMAYQVRGRQFPASEPDPAKLAVLLADTGPIWSLLVIGGGGLAVLTWLMMLKPF